MKKQLTVTEFLAKLDQFDQETEFHIDESIKVDGQFLYLKGGRSTMEEIENPIFAITQTVSGSGDLKVLCEIGGDLYPVWDVAYGDGSAERAVVMLDTTRQILPPIKAIAPARKNETNLPIDMVDFLEAQGIDPVDGTGAPIIFRRDWDRFIAIGNWYQSDMSDRKLSELEEVYLAWWVLADNGTFTDHNYETHLEDLMIENAAFNQLMAGPVRFESGMIRLNVDHRSGRIEIELEFYAPIENQNGNIVLTAARL